MRVTVEGVVTSIELKKKDDKTSTELLLAQQGQKEQVTVRLHEDQTQMFALWEVNKFEGRLMTWQTRQGVGSMVMVDA